MEREEASRSQTTNSKQNKLSRWFVSAARNVLHFFGIQNPTNDDETWEQSILNRIQNKTLGLWSSDDSLDDGSDEFVEEVLSTMSEVLSENVHILQENASSPSDYAEDAILNVTKYDWNQSARSINEISHGELANQQGGPDNSVNDSTNTATQDSVSTGNYQSETVNQVSLSSENPLEHGENDCPLNVDVEEEQSAQNDQATISKPEPDLEQQSVEGEPGSSIGIPSASIQESSNDSLGQSVEFHDREDLHATVKEKRDSVVKKEKLRKEEDGEVQEENEGGETSVIQEDDRIDDPEIGESMSIQENSRKHLVQGVDGEIDPEKGELKLMSTQESPREQPLLENESKEVKSTFDLKITDDHVTTDSVQIVTETQKSVRFCDVGQQDIGALSEIHPGRLKRLDSLSGVKLRDALDLAGEEAQSPAMEEEDSTDAKPHANEFLNPGNLAYGKEAYRNYSIYVQIERKNKTRKLRQAKLQAMEKMEWRILKIDEIITTARDYFHSPSGRAARAWRDLRQSIKSNTDVNFGSDTEIRFKLTKLHSHRPIFTDIIILVQVLVFGLLCYFGGLTKIGFEPVLELSEGTPTFLGTETIHKWVKPNIWIGPDEKYWISVGALFSTCMREDYKLMLDTSQKNYSASAVLGCCEVANKNTAGTLTQQECQQETGGVGIWKSGVPCGSRPTDQRSVSHNIKPCCINTRGECRMVSHQHCHFLEGTFHQQDNEEHCSQVNCISDVCTGRLGFMLKKMSSKREQPWLPEAPQQWWRLPLSVMYHYGIVHCLLVVGAQSFLLSPIEVTIGWFRLMILYIVCGCGGLLAAVIFNPYQPHVGATGALFGAVGLLFVELVHFWSVIKKPWLELLKLLFLMAVFIFSGTLPYLNIFSILTGLLLGMLCALGLLPYISIKRHKAVCRLIIVAVSVPLVVSLFFVMFYAFYKVQFLENCKVCKFINCYPYTENMCKLLD